MKLIVDSTKLNGMGKELIGEASSAQRREESDEGDGDGLDCDENMGQGSISLADRQSVLHGMVEIRGRTAFSEW